MVLIWMVCVKRQQRECVEGGSSCGLGTCREMSDGGQNEGPLGVEVAGVFFTTASGYFDARSTTSESYSTPIVPSTGNASSSPPSPTSSVQHVSTPYIENRYRTYPHRIRKPTQKHKIFEDLHRQITTSTRYTYFNPPPFPHSTDWNLPWGSNLTLSGCLMRQDGLEAAYQYAWTHGRGGKEERHARMIECVGVVAVRSG